MYQFHWYENSDDGIFGFLCFHQNIKNAKLLDNCEIMHSFLTLCPVKEDLEEDFSFFLSRKILEMLLRLGLSLQFALASVMPKFEFWSNIR